MNRFHLALLALPLALSTVYAELTITVQQPDNVQRPVPVADETAKPPIAVPKPTNRGSSEVVVSEDAPPGDLLSFLNGDTLHGMLVRIEQGTGLTWDHPDVEGNTTFKLENVKAVKLGGYKQVTGGAGFASVRLTNDDRLTGTIVEMNDEQLLLDTWYAGRLAIERPMLRSIVPGVAQSVYVYEGPQSLDDWKFGRQGADVWTFKKGALYAAGRNGSVGRVIEDLPDTAAIEFDFAWRGNPSLFVTFYTDRLENYGGNAYMIMMNGDYISCQRQTTNMGNQDLGNFNLSQFSTRGKAHISIRVDKESKSISLIIDGTLAKQWTDTGNFSGKGKGLVFYCNNAIPMKLSNIRVRQWDGKFETQSAKGDSSKIDVIEFVNSDKVTGRLLGIKDGKMAFKTEYATLDIPVERCAIVEFGEDKLERARRNRDDVEAFFPSGTRVTAKLETLTNGELTGHSENYGSITIKRHALSNLRFNIYDDRHDAENEEDAW